MCSAIYIVYKTTDIKTGRIYIGVHKQKNLRDDGYRGTNIHIKRIKKLCPDRLIREILFVYDIECDAYKKEREIVNEEFIARKDTFNITLGGFGSFSHIDSRGEKNPNWKGKHQKPVSIESAEKNVRRLLSDKNPMKNREIVNKHFIGRKRPSQTKWMQDNFVRDEQWRKKVSKSNSKVCEINGIKFESQTKAAEHFSVSFATITRWKKDGLPKWMMQKN